MDIAIERLIRRATPLLLGIYGYVRDEGGELVTRVGGSGIIVAPFTALTAKHVASDLMKLDPRRDRLPKGTFHAQYGCSIFQLHEPFGGKPIHATWTINESWPGQFTDISLLQFFAEGGIADRLQFQLPTEPYEWLLEPPPVGAQVTALGFPNSAVLPEGDDFSINSDFILQQAQVVEVHQPRRDRGMLNFPCFQLNMHLEGGFSGGPVLYEDKLCGVVSSSTDFDDRTYIASLWPMLLTHYTTSFAGKMRFSDLLENGTIRAPGWRSVMRRIQATEDDYEGRSAYLEEPTA